MRDEFSLHVQLLTLDRESLVIMTYKLEQYKKLFLSPLFRCLLVVLSRMLCEERENAVIMLCQ